MSLISFNINCKNYFKVYNFLREIVNGNSKINFKEYSLKEINNKFKYN